MKKTDCILFENEMDRHNHAKNESLFSLGNGYLGFRGNTAETAGNYYRGVFLNGFYETGPIEYGERAYGFPELYQTMLNLPDGRVTEFYIGDEKLDCDSTYHQSSRRQLDMCDGILHRSSVYSVNGNEIRIEYSCLVHAVYPELALQEIVISLGKPVDKLSMHSLITFPAEYSKDRNDPRIGQGFSEYPLEILFRDMSAGRTGLWLRTRNSGLGCYCGILNEFEHDLPEPEMIDTANNGGSFGHVYDLSDVSANSIRIRKYLVYSRCGTKPDTERLFSCVSESSFESLQREHKEWWGKFSARSGIFIEGDAESLLAARFSIFHLVQSAGRDGITSVAAKGLTGEGYEGHYFWDTEIYMQPFFTYTNPETAKALVKYRSGHLVQARSRAADLSQRGALYPWRTINGNEVSAYFPASTAQYHINADIMYAFFRYLRITGDRGILSEDTAAALEMAIETARFWMDLGFYNNAGAFCIHEVTGPDEYTALVNNNFYTNSMVSHQLLHTADLIDEILDGNDLQESGLLGRMKTDHSETDSWRQAAKAMFIPYSNETAIFSQDESFLSRKIWDFENTDPAEYPLLLHFHPLVIYRYQVLKQADAILAFVMEPGRWNTADKRRTFEYYEKITTGDSSLSACIQGIVAAQLGKTSLALDYFNKTAFLDLHDLHGNVKDGLHLAAAGGTWCMLVYGFAGLDDSGDVLQFSPDLPKKWTRLSFPLCYRGGTLSCTFTHKAATFSWTGEKSIALILENTKLILEPGSSRTCCIAPELKAIIFDLDGVITDTAEYHYLAWKKLCDENGFPFNREMNRKLKGISRLESLELILYSANIRKDEKEKNMLIEKKNAYYAELISRLSPSDILPGIPELLKACGEKGIHCALASASKNASAVLKRLELEFDTIADAAMVRKGKPDPEIFLNAAGQLGLRPKYCLGIEDAAAGIAAIREAGMRSAGIGQDAAAADLALKDTKELSLERLAGLFKIE